MTLREMMVRIQTGVDVFLLRPTERHILSYPQSSLDRIREYQKAAHQRARAAGDIDEGQCGASLLLWREAAMLYMAAYLTARSPTPPQEQLRASQVIAEFERDATVKPDPGHAVAFADLADLMKKADPMAFDRIPPAQAVGRLRAMREVVAWLGALTEERSTREIRLQRFLRLGALLLVALAVVYWRLVLRHPNDYIHRLLVFAVIVLALWALAAKLRARFR